MSLRTLTPVLGLLLACATSAPPAPPPAPAPLPPVVAKPPVATIDGVTIARAGLDEHIAATKLEPAAALDDLIDLLLLRAACSEHGITLAPGKPTPEARAAAELALARKLSLDVPPDADVLVVDHAWVKDAKKAATTAKQKKSLEELRGLVVAGQTIPKGFQSLKGVDGNAWHIGDHEEYPYGVVPAEAHDLQPGGISPVVPGDGGLHLFQVYARKRTPPPADAVHPVVREKLREGKVIEIVEPSLR
jgi:hypothetical protein